MQVFNYQGALYCDLCAQNIQEILKREGGAPFDPNDLSSYDSDEYPKPAGDALFLESDIPQHCAQCKVFLETPLTEEGDQYVRDAAARYEATWEGDPAIIEQWQHFYFYLWE